MSEQHVHSMVVKVQLPIVTNADVEMALIYNEDRTVAGQFPVTEHLRTMLTDEETGDVRLKAYFEATMKDGNLVLGKEVEEPGW